MTGSTLIGILLIILLFAIETIDGNTNISNEENENRKDNKNE